MTRTEKWAKGIRVLTAVPFFALLLCVWMYAGKENAFASWRHFAAAYTAAACGRNADSGCGNVSLSMGVFVKRSDENHGR